jgi:NhaA family Na+:H+ antiporter
MNKIQRTIKDSRVGNTADKIITTFQNFAHSTSAGGIVLILVTVLAMIWANSPYADSYFALWHTQFTIGFEGFALSKHLSHWINDGLMAIFFFVVGLEIKREILVGELSSIKKSMLPLMGALGGMLVPALIYFMINSGTTDLRGWGIPVATDIAFALGVLALLGDKVPVSLKVFLTALAIVDDIGAVLIIAIFYTSEISMMALYFAGGFLALLMIMNYFNVRHTVVYFILGVGLWIAFLKSGIHATIGGILLAFTIPAVGKYNKEEFCQKSNKYIEKLNSLKEKPEGEESIDYRFNVIQNLESLAEKTQSPLHRLEHFLHPYVTWAIMPIFALANAGVSLEGFSLASISNPVSMGVIGGLFVGKQLGVFLFVMIAIMLGIASLPQGVSKKQIYAVSILTGIGFTMSLFVSNLAFGTSESGDFAKIGILIASLLAGIIGYIALKITSKQEQTQ